MSQMPERFKLETKREKKYNRHVLVSSQYGIFSKWIKKYHNYEQAELGKWKEIRVTILVKTGENNK